MNLYMIVSNGGYYVKTYTVNGNDTVTATWTATFSNGKVFFDETEVTKIANKCGGTVVTFEEVEE